MTQPAPSANSRGVLIAFEGGDGAGKSTQSLLLGAWLEEIKSNTPKELKVMLIGNKSDLIVEREVSTEEGKSFAQERNLFFWETSAKKNSDKNVNTSFEALIKECMKDLMQIERQKQEMDIDQIRKQTIEIKPKHDEKKKDGCC